MMVSPWSDKGGSLPPPRIKLWFLQVALVTDMADGSGGETVDSSDSLPSLKLIWDGFRPDPDLGSAKGTGVIAHSLSAV